ncbi:hypothetical protein AB5J52_13295 [Streptomyces sp. R39]|uniref:Uncharacterized protein n=1 Tax=Streptomyces sp. R39 TaxID=3238631 RepID=A0AB39QL40_9ACTN
MSHHFGSLKALCDSATEHALEQCLDAQLLAFGPLGSTSTLQDVAAAFARPVMRAPAAGGHDLAVADRAEGDRGRAAAPPGERR